MDAQLRTQMIYDSHKKSALIAYLLWWFLGLFRAHRFYMGKVGSGVAMLLISLVSIPLALVMVGFITWAAVGVWWLVDAFLIPGWISQQNLRLIEALDQAA